MANVAFLAACFAYLIQVTSYRIAVKDESPIDSFIVALWITACMGLAAKGVQTLVEHVASKF